MPATPAATRRACALSVPAARNYANMLIACVIDSENVAAASMDAIPILAAAAQTS